jgi:hypothetical protein
MRLQASEALLGDMFPGFFDSPPVETPVWDVVDWRQQWDACNAMAGHVSYFQDLDFCPHP